MNTANVPVVVSTIHAGKLRRYAGESILKRLFDIKTNLLNIRDIFFIFIGIFQSLKIILSFKPDVVFAKGGFVCLPMGIAAKMLRKPIVIHDSDMRPGLTNRVLAKWAVKIATGSPLENYPYPQSRSVYTGVPIDSRFHVFTYAEQRAFKSAIGMVDIDRPLLVVTGGGLGAKSINDAISAQSKEIIRHGCSIFHITGRNNYENVIRRSKPHPHYQITPFIYKDMHKVLGAADIVISRGSATFLQELAGLGKPTIVVPAAHLGDQLKNAKVYEEKKAALVINDADIGRSDVLAKTVVRLLDDESERKRLASILHTFAKPFAARDISRIILSVAKTKKIR